MPEEQIAKMELELRKTLSNEIREHREFLEKLFLRVVWGAAVLGTMTALMLTYFSYETFSSIEKNALEQTKLKLESIVTKESVENFLKRDVQQISDKMSASGEFNNIVVKAISIALDDRIREVTGDMVKDLLGKQLSTDTGKDIEKLIDASVSNQISSLRKRPFSGGMFEANDSAGTVCSISNPYTGKCKCDDGFTKRVIANTKGHDGRDKFLFLCTGDRP